MAKRNNGYLDRLQKHFEHSYRVHFGVSDSEIYRLAIETAKLANDHQIFQHNIFAWNSFQLQYRQSRIPKGFIQHGWHIIEFTEDQVDLMAYFYSLVKYLPEPDIYGTKLSLLEKYIDKDTCKEIPENDLEQTKKTFELIELSINKDFPNKIQYSAIDYIKARIIDRWHNAMARVEVKLSEEGYLDSLVSETGIVIKASKQPKDYASLYQRIKSQISKGMFEDAIFTYYEITEGKDFGGMFRELMYLKFLAHIPFTGQDLVHFRSGSKKIDLINNHLQEYISFIDEVIGKQVENNWTSLLNILTEYSLTIKQMVDRVNQRILQKSVYLTSSHNAEISNRSMEPITEDGFSGGYTDNLTTKEYKIIRGKLFDKFSNLVQHCSVIEAPLEKKHLGLWTQYSPKFYQDNVAEKGLGLIGLEVYRHKKWGRSSRNPDFTSVISLQEITAEDIITIQIEYTGREHIIEGKEFYEVNSMRRNPGKAVILENPFLEAIEEIFREAENILREHHGIPRIGEGWVSEMELFGLVKKFFPDAKHHESPNWLKPQHLDIFIPSQNIAFEYQGKQHYEPVEYFGGEEAFLSTQERDLRKKKKCDQNGISLIYWHYEESINENNLLEKLSRAQRKNKTVG